MKGVLIRAAYKDDFSHTTRKIGPIFLVKIYRPVAGQAESEIKIVKNKSPWCSVHLRTATSCSWIISYAGWLWTTMRYKF
jgi:hypothetical protein